MESGVSKNPPPSPEKAVYRPVSRRPIADGFRRTAEWAVRICIQHNIHPDAISYLSMVAAGAAAACFWLAGKHPWLLIPGPAFCYLRLWCNMLDGMVALASGKASWRGEILNDLPDRISDVVIFAGVAHSGLNSVFSGYWAAIFALLTAYVGLFRPGGGRAAGIQRVDVKALADGGAASRRLDHARPGFVGPRQNSMGRADGAGLDLPWGGAGLH